MEGVREVHRARRLSVTAVIALLTLVILPGRPAFAQDGEGGNAGTEFDTHDDGVGTTVSTPGDATAGSSGGRSARSCWFKLETDANGDPKWPFVDSTGTIVLAWFHLYCDGELVNPAPYLLAVGGGTTPAARTLAEEAFKFLPLPAPSVRFNPAPAITGLATWWWVEESSWGQRTVRVGVTGLSVTVRATPESVTWSPGDGAPALSCDGPGVPYDTARPASGQRTDCAHTYRRTSAGEPGGAYAASATTRWRISWRASDGTSGALAALARTTTFAVEVEQIRTVVTSRN